MYIVFNITINVVVDNVDDDQHLAVVGPFDTTNSGDSVESFTYT